MAQYAAAFEAVGTMIDSPNQIGDVLIKASEIPGPVLLGVHVDIVTIPYFSNEWPRIPLDSSRVFVQGFRMRRG